MTKICKKITSYSYVPNHLLQLCPKSPPTVMSQITSYSYVPYHLLQLCPISPPTVMSQITSYSYVPNSYNTLCMIFHLCPIIFSTSQRLKVKQNIRMHTIQSLFLGYIAKEYPVCERSLLALRGRTLGFPLTGDVSSELESSLLLLFPAWLRFTGRSQDN
jgi:hypothetical protein